MKDNFDQHIKDLLSNFKADASGADWSNFREKLEASELSEDMRLDEASREALHNYEVQANRKSWGLLVERIEHLEYRRRLFVMKLMEAAVILLVILTFVKTFNKLQPVQLDNQQSVIQEPITFSEIDENVENSLIEAQKDPLQNFNVHESIVSSSETIEESAIVQTSSRQNPISIAESDRTANSAIPESVVSNQTTEAFDKGGSSNQKSITTQVDPQFPLIDKGTTEVVEPIEQVAFFVDESTNTMTIDHNSALLLTEIERPSRWTKQIGMVTQFNVHQLSTPKAFSSEVLEELIPLSFAYGLNASWQIGRFGFDGGMLFESLEFNDPLASDANSIRKLQVPVHLKYYTLNKEAIRAYIKGGANANLITSANYFSASARGSNPTFKDGLFNGGTLESNSYLMLSSGVGLEGKISKNFRFNMEGLYQLHANGTFGPNQTKIPSSYGIMIGLNYRLK